MAGETSGPGPSEQEIRMVALERKFDELLSFVQLIAKRNTEDENQRKEDDKDTNEGEPEGHSNTNVTPPRPPTPPKPEGEGLPANSKIDSLEEKIRLIQGIALDEREMIKIFVDTLKNPYFDRMMGLQMQFFVDLIPVGDRIEDALKTKKIVDMTALMALAEQAAKKAPTKRKEGDVQMIGRNNGRPRQVLPTFTMQPIQPRPIQAPAPTQSIITHPGPTGDSCEYHSGARGHSLDCCEEFKKKVTNLMENGLVGREEIPSERSRQPDDPSEFDWYAEINLDDIVEDEMDLDNLQDEEADWGYFMEDDTDEWRNVDLTEFFQFPYLIMPPGFVTPEFEILIIRRSICKEERKMFGRS
uniref:Uncharacterized protein n=1 Tax=Fagus sylvatica TaxID=28930 RepID=A0A2N9ITC5_FAGSY